MLRARLVLASILACLCPTAPGAARGDYTLTTLASFHGTTGANPLGGLAIDPAGNLYGTTYGGGAAGHGTAFRIDARTRALATIATFTGTNGAYPAAALTLDPKGNLYGTTSEGGAHGVGTAFRIDAHSGALATIATFNGANGSRPRAGLTIDAVGNLYGTTSGGGAKGQGTAFRIDARSGALATIATFNGANGALPLAGLTLDALGNLYGTTYAGGAKYRGTAFRIDANTRALTTLVTFNGLNGANPAAGLTIDPAGNLYGTTQYGGVNYAGTAFRIDARSGALTTLASFSYSNANGINPTAPLTLDAQGNLYGTTPGNGEVDLGKVFRIDAITGALTILASIVGPNGIAPAGGLTIDAAGNLYGATISGGAFGQGTVFELVYHRGPHG